MGKELKEKAIRERINSLEDDISKAREYIETGANAHWHKFKPLFDEKLRDGKQLPPHKDWVENVFIPSREKALTKAEKLLDKFE